MADLYAVENVVTAIVVLLRSLGHDVLTAFEDGRANQQVPDSDLLQRAIELKRCVLTNNRRHFHQLHTATSVHLGILTYTTDPEHVRLADRIHDALVGTETLVNGLIKVIRPNP